MSDATASDAATRVVVSYDPDEIDDVSRYWVENELSSDDYAAYLRRAHETATEGEEWEEFVSKGCGIPVDVTLRVERVNGGHAIDAETTVGIRARE